MNNLDTAFEKIKNQKSDINEHLDELRNLSNRCDSIIELGVKSGNSTYALLAGRPKVIKSFDISPIKTLEDEFKAYAKECNIDWKFYHEDVLKTNNICNCDMIFIDTNHTFKQMSCELFLHGNKAKKYLIFHDTVTFGNVDEYSYLDEESLDDNLKNFLSSLPNNKGIMPAIENFISCNKNWKIESHHTNNNGLLILRNHS